ncbi:MAG: hypothetical protein ACOX0U_06205 [Oscillospiraceae bacterium]|jgi:hypothetical protein
MDHISSFYPPALRLFLFPFCFPQDYYTVKIMKFQRNLASAMVILSFFLFLPPRPWRHKKFKNVGQLVNHYKLPHDPSGPVSPLCLKSPSRPKYS